MNTSGIYADLEGRSGLVVTSKLSTKGEKEN